MKLSSITLAISCALLATACNDDKDNTNNDNNVVDTELNTQLQSLISDRNIKSIEPPKDLVAADSNIAQLGKKLFFSKALSGEMDVACATCHHPNLGGGDDLALSIGTEAIDTELLGPGRLHDATGTHHDGGPTVPRNAPSTFNFTFYNKVSFHDGRVENLSAQPALGGKGDPIRTPDSDFGTADANAGANIAAAQARFPVTSAEEMRGFTFEQGNSNDDVRMHLEARLQGTNEELAKNEWLAEFQQGFDNEDGTAEDLITFNNIAFAMGEYERSQVLINNPWAEYLAGNAEAINDSAKRGALLFYQTAEQGGFDCASCHSGGFFTDENFHVVAIPQVGRGKGNGETGDDDFGRFRETGQENDKYAFRTPHLLNVTDTAPYGHDGAFATIEAVVKHHLNAANSIATYDPSTLQEGLQTDNWLANSEAAVAQLNKLRENGTAKLQDHEYTDENVTDIVAFLKALEDPCTQDTSCMSKWVPAADENDPDGQRLIAVDKSGNLL